MFEPSNEELASELLAQSHALFGQSGWGGVVGPRKEQFDRHRARRWPSARTILRMFGLRCNAAGWDSLLRAFGFTPPDNAEIQLASQRRRERDPARPSIPDEDESYPELTGRLVHEVVQLTPLGDGWYRRTSQSVIQLR